MNKENLLKIANFIETVPTEKINMEHYWCETAGCIVGNYVKNFYPILLYELSNEFNANAHLFDWSMKYTNTTDNEWDWLFSSLWYKYNLTNKQHAQRIKEFVEKGLPDNWRNVLEIEHLK